MTDPMIYRLDNMAELAWGIICSAEPSSVLNDEHILEWRQAVKRFGESWFEYLDIKYTDTEGLMVEPMINRDTLKKILWRQAILDGDTPSKLAYVERTTDAVLDYLREALTPAMLWDTEESADSRIIGEYIHRRIFGDVHPVSEEEMSLDVIEPIRRRRPFYGPQAALNLAAFSDTLEALEERVRTLEQREL